MFFPTIGVPATQPVPLFFEEEPDTCPTCLGKQAVDGKTCPTCSGSGDTDTLRFEEVDADELPEDDLDDLGKSDGGEKDEVAANGKTVCPHCGKEIVVTTPANVVH